MFDTTPKNERAILVGVVGDGRDETQIQEYLDELAFLALTAGAEVLKQFIQKVADPNPKTLIGSGKIEEIAYFIEENEIDLAIFDEELTPSQLRNLEKAFECRVIDRTGLILDIFAARARTAHARVQVELAQYQYILPRLTRMWTHLERQRGGIGLRGPGETEIETDRRIIREKIAKLKEQLKKIDKQMATQRKNRGKLVRVSLVGYTNVGKSTLMNLLGKSDVLAENKLFATLDTTVRKVVIGNLPFLLSDTVGFIRKLPHTLVESFKSTLDELRESDILIHVVDISHKNFTEQMDIVQQTLQEIGAGDKETLIVFNKTDAYSYVKKDDDDLTPRTTDNYTLSEIKSQWFARENREAVFISAKNKTQIDTLKDMLYQKVKSIHGQRYPYDDFLF